MNFLQDYLELDPTDNKTYVSYNKDGNLVSKYQNVSTKVGRVLVPNPSALPRDFPVGYIGPHYIQEGSVHDYRVKEYEYIADLTASPPALYRLNHLKDLSVFASHLEEFRRVILERLKTSFLTLVTKSDNVAMEYVKKSLFPDYNMSIDSADAEFLRQYPLIVSRYNEAKSWVKGLDQSQVADKGEVHQGVLTKLLSILDDTYLLSE